MIKCNVKGYAPSCVAVVGGIGNLYVGDANDFDFTEGAVDVNGDSSGYTMITARIGTGATAIANGRIGSITVTTAGTGYTVAPTVSFTGGGGTGLQATATVSGGLITGFTINNPGSGYTTLPTVVLTPVSGGTGGVGTAVWPTTVTPPVVTAGGSNYSSATVAVVGGGGTGATASAIITNGAVTAIAIDTPGSGYTTQPAFTITGVASAAQKLYEIKSVQDSLSVDISQSNAEGTSSAYAYEIKAKAARLSQAMGNFAKKMDSASVCCQLIFVWISNDGTVFVAGEMFVGGLRIPAFRFKQDGSKFGQGLKFSSFNGGDLVFKSEYLRLPYEFTGGIGGINAFLA